MLSVSLLPLDVARQVASHLLEAGDLEGHQVEVLVDPLVSYHGDQYREALGLWLLDLLVSCQVAYQVACLEGALLEDHLSSAPFLLAVALPYLSWEIQVWQRALETLGWQLALESPESQARLLQVGRVSVERPSLGTEKQDELVDSAWLGWDWDWP